MNPGAHGPAPDPPRLAALDSRYHGQGPESFAGG